MRGAACVFQRAPPGSFRDATVKQPRMALQACRAVLRQAASVLSDCTDAPTAGAVLTSVLDALEGAAAGSASASQGRDALQCLQQSAEPAVRQLSLSIAALAADPRGPDQAWRCACWECGDMLVDVLMPGEREQQCCGCQCRRASPSAPRRSVVCGTLCAQLWKLPGGCSSAQNCSRELKRL